MPRYILSDEVKKFSPKMSKSLGEGLRLANYLKNESGFDDNVSISALINRLKDLELIHQSIPYQTGIRWRSSRTWNPVNFLLRRLKRIF